MVLPWILLTYQYFSSVAGSANDAPLGDPQAKDANRTEENDVTMTNYSTFRENRESPESSPKTETVEAPTSWWEMLSFAGWAIRNGFRAYHGQQQNEPKFQF